MLLLRETLPTLQLSFGAPELCPVTLDLMLRALAIVQDLVSSRH